MINEKSDVFDIFETLQWTMAFNNHLVVAGSAQPGAVKQRPELKTCLVLRKEKSGWLLVILFYSHSYSGDIDNEDDDSEEG